MAGRRAPSDLPIVLHAGFHKTGTTSVQRQLMPRHPEILPLGPYDDDIRPAWEQLFCLDEEAFDHHRVAELFQKARARRLLSTSKVVLCSNEELTDDRPPGRFTRCERASRVFNPTTVLFVLRHQIDALESSYWDSVQYEDPRKKRSFEEWLNSDARSDGRIWRHDYGRTIECYMRAFGRERIRILLYEDLAQDAPTFLTEFSKLLGIDPGTSVEIMTSARENVRKPRLIGLYQRWLTHSPAMGRIASRIPASLRRRVGEAIRARSGPPSAQIGPSTLQELRGLYSEGNRWLEDNFRLPLEERGYPM